MSPRPDFDSGFSTPALTQIFSAASTVKSLLEFEAALALALADAGMAPEPEAAELAAACEQPIADSEGILRTTWVSGTPIPALREAVAETVSEPARQWFHFGATTQDAVDSALMLQSRDALRSIQTDLVALAGRLRHLVVENRDQPHLGRTFLQTARPTTFGLRCAEWLDMVLDDIESLRWADGELALQLGGSVGTRSAYGDRGDAVAANVARRLGLRSTRVPWHTDRSRILTLAHVLQRTSRSMAKLATDVAWLSSSSLGELAVRWGGSSSMPEKRNPIDAIRAIAAAAATSGAVTALGSAPIAELDRGTGGWHVEWMALPLVFHTTGAAVESMRVCFESLEVDAAAMTAAVGDIDLEALLASTRPLVDSVLRREV